jgi:hypothetical protein
LTLKEAASGAVIQIDAKKTGWMYVVAKISSNKQYVVFEEGKAIGYKIAMEINDSRFPENKINLEIKGEGAHNYIPEGRLIQWVVREALGDAEASTAGNGLGVFYFPVKAGLKYYAHATATKISWCGVYFSNAEASSVKVAKEYGTQFEIVHNEGGGEEENPDAVASISETTVRSGYQATIPVQFESELEFGGLQCEVTLPAGVTLNKVTKTERLSDVFTLTKSLTGENTYQILLYNIERATFAGTNGALFNLVVDVAENMEVGNYEIQVKDIVASNVDGNETALADISAVLHVEEYLIGDANNDGKVNVTDIMAVASHILKYNVPGFNAGAADVNGDGKINVTDIMGIANIILQPNNAPVFRQSIAISDPD